MEGRLSALLSQALVDQCVTNSDHPAANGLTERAVQTVNRALRKLGAERSGCMGDGPTLDSTSIQRITTREH